MAAADRLGSSSPVIKRGEEGALTSRWIWRCALGMALLLLLLLLQQFICLHCSLFTRVHPSPSPEGRCCCLRHASLSAADVDSRNNHASVIIARHPPCVRLFARSLLV